MINYSGDLQAWLKTNNQDYRLLEQTDTGFVRFEFIGVFDDQTIVWDARLYSLATYAANLEQADTPRPTQMRSFIEIAGLDSNARRQITIGLPLAKIDTAAITKTIIMVRQYKRLRQGRHEFGAPTELAPNE